MKTRRLNLLLAAVFAVATLFLAGIMARLAHAQEPAATGRSGHTEGSLAGGMAIHAELNSSIDSKKAKSGDAVVAHTTEAVKSSDDRIILPRGTKLMGHITQATARSKGDPDSALGIGFDKAILKGGEEVPLNVTIQALAAPASGFAAGSSGDMQGPNGPSTYPSGPGNPRTPGNNPSMPGNGGTRPTTNGTPGYPSATGTSSQPDAAGGIDASGELAPNSRGVLGLDGLHLMTAAKDSTQTSVVSSTGKNVHLDGGTRLLLVTQTLASGAPGK